MDDEKFWYLDRWGRLRSMILRVAYNDIDILLAYCTMPHQVEEALRVARSYIDAVIRELDRNCRLNANARSGYGGPWGFALRLFTEPAALARVLVDEREPICGRLEGVSAGEALGQALRRYLNEARQPLVSPGAPNRVRVWGEICVIDREVSHNDPVTDPLEPDHLNEVMEAIAVRVTAGNRNLPRTLETLSGYYQEFDPRCRDQDYKDVPVPQDWIKILIDMNDVGPQIRQALLRMPVEFRTSFRHWLGVETYQSMESEQDFCCRQGLSRREYRHQVQHGKEFLRDALEGIL